MIRTLNIILALTSMCAMTAVYALKYSVEETAGEKLRLEQRIRVQESDLSLLHADWAYLNQPAHIEPIVKRHAAALGLVPASQLQIGGIDMIPMRPAVPNEAELGELLQSLEAGVDPAGQTALE
jgi:hypothetical protein